MPNIGRPRAEVVVTDEERTALVRLTKRARVNRAVAFRARIVLACIETSDTAVARRLRTTKTTVAKWRSQFVERRLAGLYDEPRVGAPRTISDEQVEALIVKTLETTPPGETHWSTRSMAKAAGVSHTMVGRIWRTFRLQPHRTESFKISPDPQLVEKIRDVVGLYVAPPANAVVFSVDEKSQIQALQRAQPILPMDFGQPERRTHNYVRHGTLDLFAALNVATGEVIARCKPQHRAQDFVAFLREIESTVEHTLDIHVVLDNLSAHPAPQVQRWLLRHPRVHFHFTAHVCVVAQSGGAVLWIAHGESARTRIAHEHCAVARRHPRVRRRPQRPRHTVQMGEDGRRDPRQHAAIRGSRSAGARSMTRLILEIKDPGDEGH